MENNKKKIVIVSIVGVILLLLIIISVAFSKGNNKNIEVANSNIEEPEIEEPEIEEPESEEPEIEEPEIEEPEIEESEIEESEIEESETEESETEESETEESETEESETDISDTETTEPTANGNITTVSNWGTPQEYNGDPEGRGPDRIIVKGFDYNDFDNAGEAWKGEYWTASNGVEIKVLSAEGYENGMIPVPDGKGKDLEPNSPFQVAFAEALGIDINKFKADMNVTIPLATYKRAEIDINDSNLVAFRNAYDYKLSVMKGLEGTFTPYEYGEAINLRLGVATDGIGEFDYTGAKVWYIRKVNDYWELRMNVIPADFRWEGIHQILRYLSPDGDSLYDVIYEDCYTGSPVILEYDDWFAVGNSQIYQKDPTGLGYVIYRFK